jgi:hypothetical protein
MIRSPLLPLLFVLSALIARAEEQVLFSFDDHSLPWRDNLQLNLVEGTKHPENPVVKTGPEGAPDFGHAVLYGSVIYDGGKFRMWYLGMIQREIKNNNAPGWWRPMCYAESTDGIHWTKPELNLVDLNGNTKNNICLIESDPFSLSRVNDYLTVLYEPNDPDPQKRYKSAFIAHLPFEDVKGGRSAIGPDEKRWGSIVTATSADGLKWKVVGDRPVNATGERFEVSGLYHFDNFYYATGQLISPWTWRPDGNNIGRSMLTYRSPDFEHWSHAKAFSFARPVQMTGTIEKPLENEQTHMGAGIWNRGDVLVGFYGMWHHGPKERPKGANYFWGLRIDLGMIVSNDGIHFREPVSDFKMLKRGEEGKDWDSIALLQGHAFANVGEKTYVWYSHWDCEGQFRHMEIGLATWRRDGFGYLVPHVAAAPAQCVSKTIAAEKKDRQVFINAEGATAEAPLKVEVLDDRDQPLADYSGDNAAIVSQDALHSAVTWPKVKSSQLPAGKAVSLRVNFPTGAKARLYALYVGENK